MQTDDAPEVGDDILDAIERAAPFADREWNPSQKKLRPSVVISIRYCVLMADGGKEEKAAARSIVNNWFSQLRLDAMLKYD
ncbi:hypothetical protein [Sphingomonas sp.]|uniref:hypothetical protein n=1 Tax=Sphingomonas sp. TaxID=28214 RepID=UPI003B0059A6